MSCKCDVKLFGLGAARCTIDFNIIRGLIFVDISKNDYLNYYYPDGSPKILQMIQQGVAIVSPKLFDVTANKEASTKQTFGDGTSYFVREGIRTLTATLAKPIPYQIGAFNRMRCRKVGVYLLDNNNYILGYVNNENYDIGVTPHKLLPIPIQNETIDAILQFATDSTVRTGTVEFQFDNLVSDSKLRATTLITTPISLTSADLISNPPVSVFQRTDVTPTYNTTTNTLTVELGFHNGQFNTFEPLTTADFSTGTISMYINNVLQTQPYSSVTISGNTVTLVAPFTAVPGDMLKIYAIQLNYPFIHIIQEATTFNAI